MTPQGLKTEFWSSETWAYNVQSVRNPLSECKTFPPANQIARFKLNDEELELYSHVTALLVGDHPQPDSD